MLVDTGMTELHPALADMDPRLRPLNEQDFDLAGIDIVVNTHLHGDHCGGTTFLGKPIYVQRQELEDARSEDDYTIREWLEAPGVRYVPVDGELELLPRVQHQRRAHARHVGGRRRDRRATDRRRRRRRPVQELEEPHTEGQLLRCPGWTPSSSGSPTGTSRATPH